jgi:hypothetical protein
MPIDVWEGRNDSLRFIVAKLQSETRAIVIGAVAIVTVWQILGNRHKARQDRLLH